jgi:glycine cleavage system protein P-like pyridoxal-binding family
VCERTDGCDCVPGSVECFAEQCFHVAVLAADYPELGPALLVCATETKTTADLQRFVDSLRRVLEAA